MPVPELQCGHGSEEYVGALICDRKAAHAGMSSARIKRSVSAQNHS